MLHASHSSLQSSLKRFRSAFAYSKFWLIGFLSMTSLGCGLIPAWSPQYQSLRFGTVAVAQSNVSEDEVESYARAVLAIEPIRQLAYNEIKKIIGSGDMPPIACHRSESLANIPESVQSIAVNYCTQSKKIVESNGLTISRFNAITMAVQNNPDLEKRIQSELIRLQKPAATK